MKKALLVATALVGYLFAGAPAFAGTIGGGCSSDPVCATGDASAPSIGVPNFSNNSNVDGAAGPWDTGINSNFAYGDGAQGPATTITLSPSSNVYTVTYLGGTTTTNTSDNPPTNVDANGYGCCQLQGPGSNAPAAYIPGGIANLNELVGTFTDNSGTIVGTPFVIGDGPTLIGPSAGATQLHLGINDNQYIDNAGQLNVAVTGYATGTGKTIVGNTGSGTLTITGGTYTTGTLIAGSQDGSDGTIDNAGVLIDDAIIGDAGTGSMTNTGAHAVVGNLILGNQPTGNGTYTITGNTAQTTVSFASPSETPNGALIVGNQGTGSFTQGAANQSDPGNQVTVAGDLAVGLQAGSQGTYTLNTGTLTVGGAMIVGAASTNANQFTQNGGTINLTGSASGNSLYAPVSPSAVPSTSPGSLYIGGESVFDNGTGTYTMTGGNLNVNSGNIFVGYSGTGTVNQSAGRVTSGVLGVQRGDLLIGAQAGSTGNYNLGDSTNGAPTLQVYGDTTIGRDAGANGTLTIAGNGTTMSVNQYTGFDTRNGGNMLVGLNGTGAVSQTDASTVYTDHNVVLGANAGSSGTYTLNANSLGGSPPNLFVGSDLNIGGMTSSTDIYNFNFQTTVNGGTGTFNLKSGDVATAGAVNVGNNDGTGALNISGGTLAAGNGMNIGVNDFTIANDTGGIDRSSATGGGSGTVTQTAGAVTVGSPTNSTALNLGITGTASDPTTGTYTITGASTLDVYGNADIGVSTGATGTMTIGSGLDSPTVNIHSTSVSGFTDGNLTVGDTGTGNLTVNSGALSIDGGLSIGVNGTGTVIQTGGTVTAAIVDMNTPVGGGSASYTISGGTLHSTGDLNVGGAGAGPVAFSQSGDLSMVNVDGTLRVGNFYNTGSYTLSGGTLNVGGDSLIGNDSLLGTMNQSGGSHLVNGTLTLGDGTGSSGLYTLSGGILTTGITGGSSIGDVVIGNHGTGELDNSGGIQTSKSANGLTLGFFGGSQGTYKLTGTGSLSVAGNENVGVFGAGIFQQGDGSGTTSNTVGGSLYISSGFGGPASSYTLTDGTLTVTGSEVVGFGAQGGFTQSGGTNSVTGGLTLGLLSNSPTQFGAGTYTLGGSGALSVGGDLVLGSATGTTGTFNYNTAFLDSGTLSFTGSGQTLVVGDVGKGTFNEGSGSNTTDLNLQTSGTTLDIGRSAGGNGTFNLAAGSSLEDDMIVGDAGTGVFNNTGGMNTVGTSSVPANLVLGNQSTGNGTYNNNNGGNNTVNGNLTVGGAGTGIYNLGNGTSGADLQVQGSGLSGGNVVVGETGTGTITASSGSVANVAGVLTLGGSSPGETTGNGTLTVTGAHTEWTNKGQAVIGGAGTGTLNVLAGGYFESHIGVSGSGTAASLGVDAGSTGTATVDGTNSEWNMPDGALRVGVSSTGSGNGAQGNVLTISNGGEVIDNAGNGSDGNLAGTDDGAAASVGWRSGSVGTVNVVTGGTWSNSGDLVIGDAGTGTVHLDNSSGSGIAVGGNLILGNLASGNGTLNLDNAGLLNLNHGIQFIVGNAGTGVVNQNGGNLNLTTAGVTLEIGAQGGSNGTYNLNSGSLEDDDLVVGNAGTGTFNNNGMTHTVSGNLILGNQSTGIGTYNLTGAGTLTVSGNATIGNAGSGALSETGGATVGVSGSMTIAGNSTVSLTDSTITVTGTTTNNGTVTVSNSTAHWNSTFTNNGAYKSDPSTSYFTDLAVGTNGYLTGGAGDVFNVSGNFTNTSTKNTLWNTTGATLEYSGTAGTSHTMDLVGLDEGPVAAGFTNNYAWGLLDLDSGNSLSLDGTVGTNALYVAALEGLDISGDDITNIDGNGLNIYYNPADDTALGDLTYALADGGFLCPIGASTCTVSTSPPPPQVPEPGSMLLLGGGLAGLAFVRRRVARLKGQASTR